MKWSSGVAKWGRSLECADTVQVDELTPERFDGEYVDRCQPVLVKGATRKWGAAERWQDPAYLKSLLAGKEFDIRREPVLEMHWRSQHWPERFASAFASQESQHVSLEELIRIAASGAPVFAYAQKVDSDTPLSGLESDIGQFDFLPRRRNTNSYAPLRAFLHGISYTDWHYHKDDETLMCQFGRSKVVHLLPPDQHTWDVFYEIGSRELRYGDADPAKYPGLATLKPRIAEVHPGDALYIPPNWWHAVACQEPSDRLGITLAYCWGSPWHILLEPRFPFRKFYIRHGPLRRRAQLAAAAVAWKGLDLAGRTLPNVPGSDHDN